MSEIRFVRGRITALDNRIPVRLIHTDEHGTATIEFYDGERKLHGVESLEPAECYCCKGTTGEMKITPYGSVARLRCVHAGPCPKDAAERIWISTETS
jgi:hypothetical protein